MLKAITETRPKIGKDYVKELDNSDIETDNFFVKIQDYKSEFAYNLAEALNKNPEVKFKVPTYIKNSFCFLTGDQ